MKKLYAIVIFLFLSIFSYSNVITYVSSNFYINWTEGKIIFEYEDYSPFLIGNNFDVKLLTLKNSVKRKIISQVYSLLREIPFDENRKVKDILDVFPDKRKSIVSLIESIDIDNFRYFGGKSIGRYVIDIYGNNGILNILRLPYIPRDYREYINMSEPKEYTGLLISVKNFNFNVALSVNIISEAGKIIYSYGDYKGNDRYIHFFKSLKDAIDSGIFGDNILYTVPLRIEGENSCNIVLEDSVLEKLLSIDNNHDIFFSGKVGIIIED